MGCNQAFDDDYDDDKDNYDEDDDHNRDDDDDHYNDNDLMMKLTTTSTNWHTPIALEKSQERASKMTEKALKIY